MKLFTATQKILRSALLLVAVSVSLSACETTEINTRSATTLPIKVGKVLVIYEMGNLDKHIAPTAVEVPAEGKVRMAESLGKAVQQRIPAGLETKGIATEFVLLTDDKAQPPANTSATHTVRIRAYKDVQVCKENGMCTHRLSVRASVLRTGSGAVLWSTEFEEPAMSPLAIDSRRFESLAQNILYSVSWVLRSAP